MGEFPGGPVVKDPALSLLWLGFNPWPWNFHMPWAWPKKKGEWKLGVTANESSVTFQEDANALELNGGGGCLTF